MASTLSDDTAPSASLDHLEAQAAPTHPGAPPEHLGGLPWPQELASGRPKVEDFPLSTTRHAGVSIRVDGVFRPLFREYVCRFGMFGDVGFDGVSLAAVLWAQAPPEDDDGG